MKQYSNEIKKIIDCIKQENIISVSHCITRLRFILKDYKNIDTKLIEEISFVKGVFKATGQFQIVIGLEVKDVFEQMNKMYKFERLTKEEIKQKGVSTASWWQRALTNFSEIFIPIIPAIIAGGLISAIRNIFETNFDGYKLVDQSGFIKGLNDFLLIPTQAIFWYLPVLICWSIFQKNKCSPAIGIIIGLTLLIPPLEDIYILNGKLSQNDKWIFSVAESFDFGKWKFPWKISYTAQVLPAILVSYTGVAIEKLLYRYIKYKTFEQIVNPLITVLFTYTLAHIAIGPFGYVVGDVIALGSNWMFTHKVSRYIFTPIFGLVYAPLVVTGLHHMFNAIMLQSISIINETYIFPILAISNICQGASVLMFLIIHWKNKKIRADYSSSLATAWLGVTEPAMYGVNLKYLYPFFGSMIGSMTGALFISIAGVSSTSIGNGGILAVLNTTTHSRTLGTWKGTGFLWFVIAVVLSIGTSMLATYLFRKIKKFKVLEEKLLILNVKVVNN